MDEGAIERARGRLLEAAEERAQPADVEAALERARAQMETLAAAAAELEASLPVQVAEALREGLRAEAGPVARRVNEIKGLTNQVIRRLEHLEGELTAERYSRVDDLGLLVDLIDAGWRGVDDRLRRIEDALAASAGATVYKIEREAS
jgi:hypothetical protein